MNITKIPKSILEKIDFIAQTQNISAQEYVRNLLITTAPGDYNKAVNFVNDQKQATLARLEANAIEAGGKSRRAIAAEVLAEIGDSGTCVGGMKLYFRKVLIAEGIAQGSLTNYEYFERVTDNFIKFAGASKADFTTDEGWID